MARAKSYARLLAAGIDAAAVRVVRARRKSKGLRFAEASAAALVNARRFDPLPAELRTLRLCFVVALMLGAAADELPTLPRGRE